MPRAMENQVKPMESNAQPMVVGPSPMWDGVPEPVEDAPTARVVPFANRYAAGRLLARALSHHAATDAIVLGLAHGGLVVADAVAQTLGLPRDVWVVKRLSAERAPELTLGVISEGAALVLDRDQITASALTHDQIRALVREAAEQLAAEARRHRCGKRPADLLGKTVILVDDGILSGGTLSAALDGVQRRGASKVVIAAPVGAQGAVMTLRREAHEVVCLATPTRLRRVGAWYQDYRQVSDGTVMKILGTPVVS